MADLKRFFKKTISEERHKQAASVSVPEGLWIKCPKCGEMVYKEDVISNAYACPKCGGYFRIMPYMLIKSLMKKSDYVMSYFHPSDFDPGQPPMPHLSRMRQFKNRVGLKNAYSKFQKLIADFDFASLEAIDRRIDWSTVRIINL